MGRSRNIKPGFFTNDELVELPFEYRLLFAGLWTIADRDGRLVDRPKKIKLEIFPGDDVDCAAGLQALVDSGFIERYEVGGKKFIQVLNWHKHQTPHHKEVASQIPAKPIQEDVDLKEESVEAESADDTRYVDDASNSLVTAVDDPCIDEPCAIEIASCPTDSLQSDSLQSDSLQNPAPAPPTPAPKRFIAADMDLPVAINSESWLRWCRFRSGKKKPISELAAEEQHKLLAAYDHATQAQIVSQSIQNDYQGLFPPKGGQHGQTGQSGSGNQRPDNSAAGQIRAAVARRQAERAVAAGAGGVGMADHGVDVRAPMDEQLRSGAGPGQGMGVVLEGAFERSD